MNINRGILIGIIAGVIVSSALVFSSDFTAADAMIGGGGSGGSGRAWVVTVEALAE